MVDSSSFQRGQSLGDGEVDVGAEINVLREGKQAMTTLQCEGCARCVVYLGAQSILLNATGRRGLGQSKYARLIIAVKDAG